MKKNVKKRKITPPEAIVIVVLILAALSMAYIVIQKIIFLLK